MDETSVKKWRQRGKLYLWRFPHEADRDPGWCCHADSVGGKSVIDLFERMLGDRTSKLRTVGIKVTIPTPEIARLPGSTWRWTTPKTFTIIYPPSAPGNEMRWSGDYVNPVLTIGAGKLFQLRSAFASLEKYNDFCVSPDDQKRLANFETMAIWFW